MQGLQDEFDAKPKSDPISRGDESTPSEREQTLLCYVKFLYYYYYHYYYFGIDSDIETMKIFDTVRKHPCWIVLSMTMN
jgi:hypothetical protein